MRNVFCAFSFKEPSLSNKTPAKMDYQGQKKAQRIAEILLLLGTVVAFIAGYLKQDLLLSGGVFAVFFALAFVSIGPNYSCYNRNHPNWLPVEEEKEENEEKDK